MAQTSKDLIAILLVITMIVSLVGTMAALTSLNYNDVPVKDENLGETSGKVSVFLLPQPAETTGKVAVNVLTNENGG